jgi:putative RNA 2'-phosphotransferase
MEKHLSKFLSLVLRHQPEKIGISLDPQGWVSVEKLLLAMQKHGHAIDLSMLKKIVDENDKKRFAFNEDLTMIRANQGHSVEVDLAYQPTMPPDILYHGTANHLVQSILEKGLIKGDRHHVHLSADQKTAIKVGQRHGKPVVFQVSAKKMHDDGLIFYQSENAVWLTDHVPVRFLAILNP